jgi:hypothetical protein
VAEWTSAGAGDVSSDGTASTIGEVTVYTDTGQKEIGRSNILFGSGSPTVGTRTLGATGLFCGAHIVTGGTIIADGLGSMALGYLLQTSGTCTMDSAGAGSFAGGYMESATGTAGTRATEIGAFTWGACVSTTGGNGALIADGAGCWVGGFTTEDSAIEATASTAGAFVHGRTSDGGVLQAGGNDASFVHGSVAGSGSMIQANGEGAFSCGTASGGGNILASGAGALAVGSTTSGTISASATGSVQFSIGTNAEADSLQVGDTTDGVRLNAGGAPGTSHNGDIWVDGSGNVIIRSNGADITIA